MAVGLVITQAEINNLSGSIARSVFASARDVLQFKRWLDTITTTELETNFSYSSGEAAVLKSAYTDLAVYAGQLEGGAPKADPYDYGTFARRLIGPGVY